MSTAGQLAGSMQNHDLAPWKVRAAQPLAVAGALLVAALLLRGYRLSNNLLWLDEIYGYQLGQLGPATIIRNSSVVPHPPLYYLIQYATSGFDSFHSAWALRWFSVVCGAASVPLLYLLAKSAASTFSAFLVGVLFLVSPPQIFFSQESRPYALLVCLMILTALLVVKLQEQPDWRIGWLGLAGLSLAGIWCGYSFIMVTGVQLLYLALVRGSWRYLLACGGAIALGCLPLVGISIATLRETHTIYVASAPVTPGLLAQALLTVDYARYGMFWAHTWVPIALAPVVLLGLWRAIRRRGDHAGLYHAMQVALPLAGFFIVTAWLLHVRLPTFEWKQFIILTPSLFVLIALGIDQLRAQRFRWGGGAIAVAVTLFVVAASMVGLQRYWTTQKSPEGSAALFVHDHMQPNDAVVSLHYSLDAAVSFYVPDTIPYTKPQPGESGLLFARSASLIAAAPAQPEAPATTAMIHQHPRTWVMYLASKPESLPSELVAPCAQAEQHDFPPFRVLLVRDCR